jgi:hypothetical protein
VTYGHISHIVVPSMELTDNWWVINGTQYELRSIHGVAVFSVQNPSNILISFDHTVLSVYYPQTASVAQGIVGGIDLPPSQFPERSKSLVNLTSSLIGQNPSQRKF